MEIKCQHCSHVGAPSSMTPTERGISLGCSKCGLANVVENDTPTIQDAVNPSDSDSFSNDENFQKLVPLQGDGYRCPKCFSILTDREEPPDDNCRVCGLDLLKDYANLDHLPWEQPPPEKSALFEQGLLLWKSLEENPSSLQFEKFVAFTDNSGFHDLQIRKLRGFLVSYPENEHALKYLRIQSQKIQSRIIVAQTQSETESQLFGSRLQGVRQKLLIAVAVGLFLIIILFVNFLYV